MSWKLIQFKMLIAIGLFNCNFGLCQDVSDFFHTASQQYIHGKITESKQTIESAIRLYPNDPKLKVLLSKIMEEDNKKNPKKKTDNQDQDKKDDKQKQEEQNKNISQEDANRILEAMQNEEKELQKKLKAQKVQQEKGKTLKNW